MRIFGLILFLAGLGLVFGDRFFSASDAEYEIGRYELRTPGGEARQVAVGISAEDAPISATLEFTVPGGSAAIGAESEVFLVIHDEQGPAANKAVTVSQQGAELLDGGRLRVADAVRIQYVVPGEYTFTIAEGAADELGLGAVDLVLKGNSGAEIYDVQPFGFVLLAVGGVLAMLGRRKRRAQSGEPVQPVSKTSSIGYRQPEPKAERGKRKPRITWGRAGDKD